MALLFESETHAILGACFEVYREKGCGFLDNFGHYPKAQHERFIL